MQKKILFLFISIFSVTPFANATVDTTPVPTLDYIINAGSGVYHLYGKNLPSDRNLVNVYIDNKKVDQINVILTKEGINIRNFYRDSGDFMIERLKVTYGSGDIAKYSTDKKTSSLKIRGNTSIAFDGQIFRENKNGYDIVRIPFLNEMPSNFSEGMLPDRKIVVNGQEKPLVPFMDEYKDGVYYFTEKGVIFLEKNLPERLNTVGFKIDGLSSNYVTVKKEWILLESPSWVEIEDIWTSKNIKVTFTEPKNFINLTGKEIYVNGAKIDNGQVTVGLNQLIIKYDILRLSKDQDHLSIILKDTLTNQYSNEQIISVGKFSRLLITGIDTGEWTSGNFTFVIHGNMNALFGDVYNFKININGTDYTRGGTQELVKDGSGVIQKDSNGANKYITKNKIEFKKTGIGIEFDFFYNQLKDWENILFIKNQNTGRESNKVSFTIGKTPVINYNYLTGAILDEIQKKETLTFEIGKDFEKKPNSANMVPTDRNISFGKIKSTYLKNNEFYNMEFLLDTDLTINPFSSLKLDTMNLEIVKNNGKISFLFKKQWFGKDFKASMELLGVINELYNTSNKAFSLTIKEISLKKLSKEDTFETLISIKNPLNANIFYFYTKSNCFDGTKDFCSIIGEADPSLAINYSSSGAPITIVAPTQVVPPPSTVSATGTTAKIVRRNISTVILYDFENKKFKKVQDILVQKYEILKKRGSVFSTTFRNATNNLLLALKNYEMNIDRTTSIAQVGSSLKTLNEALRKAKKE